MEQAFPSSPTRVPTINVWFKYGDVLERLQCHALCARWAALKFVQVALNDRSFDGPDDDGWYETEDGLLMFKLQGDVEGLMDDIEDEIDWEIPQPDLNQCLFAAGLQSVKHEAEPEEKPNKVRKVRAPSAAPVSRDGLITLAEICEELKMEPRDARKILRDKVEKPDAGWCWPPEEAKKIKAILK